MKLRATCRLVATVVVSVAVGFVAACGSDATPPTEVAVSATSDGAEIYAAACASCHGDDLRGTDKGPSHLSVVYEPNHHGDAAFLSAIANGSPQHHWNFGDMEPIEGLSQDQALAVVAFIRAEQERLGFEQ